MSAAPRWSIDAFQPSRQAEWDAFVASSKNGTFMFQRGYMDYHSDRFIDASLLVRRDSRLVALLPANRVDDQLHSHQGLTYGGLVVSEAMTTPVMLEMMEALIAHLRDHGFRALHYKTAPTIYHRLPAEEDRYALFRLGASLVRRDVLSVIAAGRRGPVQERRRRSAAKSRKQGVIIAEAADWKPYWTLLTQHLQERYGVAPVHTLEEIELLRSRFSHAIRLFEACIGSETLAGVVVFESAMVAHVQYIGSSALGRETGALDAIFEHLIEQVFSDKPFFDFGISNEQQGRYLNIGLIEQKEGFGSRAIVHDFYKLDVSKQ